LRLKRIVALKVLSAGSQATEEQLSRFRSEAEFVARLQHPNIVQVFEIGEWHAAGSASVLPYLALEFVAGGTLKQKVAAQPQQWRCSADFIETLARAMDHANQNGVIHRDLKPANILLAADGEGHTPKITDFGLAKQLQDRGALSVGTDQTQTGVIL